MDKLILILTFFLTLTGCRCKHDLTKTVITKDSLITKDSIVFRDKLVWSKVDSASIKALVKCPDLPEVIKKGKHAQVKVSIKNGQLKADCLCDSTAIRYQERERYQRELKQHLNAEKTVVKEVEKQVPILAWLAMIIELIIILTLIFKTTRR